MDDEKLVRFIKTSLFASLLDDKDVTDISFNGRNLYYLHNKYGRCKSQYILTKEESNDFIRQIANMAEKQFSYVNPLLDISFGLYRINAVHQSIGRYHNKPVITFSIRIASEKPRISKDSGFFPLIIDEFIECILKAKLSIVIAGETGSGKTEFQKYLLSKVVGNTRIIAIDNVLELDVDYGNDMDLNIWEVNEKNESTHLSTLIKNALRNNPDWIVVAESRGEEMIDTLSSVMSGHPIITTLHAKEVEAVPNRITRMVMMNKKQVTFDDVKKDVMEHFRVFFFLKRVIDDNGVVTRYIESISLSDGKTLHPVYRRIKHKDNYYKFSKNLLDNNNDTIMSKEFQNTFIKEVGNEKD